MSAKENLFNSPLFWMIIGIPIMIALVMGCLMASNAGLVMQDATKESVNFTADFFKVPIWVASLAFPLGAIFIANHRSKQAVLAMEISREQNNFSNYYTHREQFQKRLNDLNLFEKIDRFGFRINSYVLYSMVFSSSSVKSIQIESDRDVYEKMIKINNDAFQQLVVENYDKDTYIQALIKWARLMGMRYYPAKEKHDDIGIGDISDIITAITGIVIQSVEFGVVNSNTRDVFEKGAKEYARLAFKVHQNSIKIDRKSY